MAADKYFTNVLWLFQICKTNIKPLRNIWKLTIFLWRLIFSWNQSFIILRTLKIELIHNHIPILQVKHLVICLWIYFCLGFD